MREQNVTEISNTLDPDVPEKPTIIVSLIEDLYLIKLLNFGFKYFQNRLQQRTCYVNGSMNLRN